MRIILFGTGCDLCREIAANIETAIASAPCRVDFEKTADLGRMLSYGIKSTPSVVIDGSIVSVSKPLGVEEIIALMNAGYAKIMDE